MSTDADLPNSVNDGTPPPQLGKESFFSTEDSTTRFSDGRTSLYTSKKHPAHFPTGTTEVLTFYPTIEEFKDFSGYIRKIEAIGAHGKCGICKIVPPEGWTPRPSKKNFDDVDQYLIKTPVKEVTRGEHRDYYEKYNEIYKKQMSVEEFRRMANLKAYRPPRDVAYLEGRDLERYMWEHIKEREPIYGADTEGSIYDEGVEEFNMNQLGTVLDEYRKVGIVRGVNTVYLYFGMFKTSFPWHAEDMDLYSINYLHYGAPKYWWGIPAEAADRFEKILDQYFPEAKMACRAHPRHKLCLINPDLLRLHNIPFGSMIQRPNEFMITFPRGYHMGFNLGYNCAESTNFAIDRWIDYGKNVVICQCKESVTLNMEIFLKRYRKEEFQNWKQYWYARPNKYIPTYPYPRLDDKNRLARARHNKPQSEQIKRKRGNWMKSQAELNSRSHPNLFYEKGTNQTQSRYPPHCAVCLLFWPKSHWQKLPDDEDLPQRSKRLIKAKMFAKGDVGTGLSDPKEDILVTCSHCKVTVHPSCYGGDVADPENWRCFRCPRGRDDTAIRFASCNLCEMRGGALLPCEVGIDLGMVHVTCAIMNRRTSFNREVGPTRCKTYPSICHLPTKSIFGFLDCAYLNAENDFTETSRWNCEICGLLKEGLIRCSLCAEYNPPHEITLAHTTCAKEAGFFFEEREFPQNTAMICDKHFINKHGEDKPLIDVGKTVRIPVGKENETGHILDFKEEYRVAVSKLDGQFEEIDQSEVINCNCLETKCDKFKHQDGARLWIKTNEGEDECYYRDSYVFRRYTVQSEHSTVILDPAQILPIREVDQQVVAIPSEPMEKKNHDNPKTSAGGKRPLDEPIMPGPALKMTPIPL